MRIINNGNTCNSKQMLKDAYRNSQLKNGNKGFLFNENTSGFMQPKILSKPTENRGVIIKTGLIDINVNRNKRRYTFPAIKSGFYSSYVQERIYTKSWYGEAGHPLNPDMKRQLYLDQSNMSHRVNSFEFTNNNELVLGEVESANTVRGNDFKGCILQECKVAFSLRAVGPCTEKDRSDILIVKEPLLMFAFDWVVHPSYKSAYMSSIISEDNSPYSELLTEDVYPVGNTGDDMLIELNESVVMEFLQHESKTVNQAIDSFALKADNIKLVEDLSTIYIRDEYQKTTVGLYLEDNVIRTLNDYLLDTTTNFRRR